MKKLILNLGNHNGYYQITEGKYGTPSYKEEQPKWFSANSRTPEYCEWCEFVNSQIVSVLAKLTSTGKTKVVLVNDDFIDLIKSKAKGKGIVFF